MTSLDGKKFLNQLGERIRRLREERELTQQQLGDKCDLHRAYIGSVERGERNVSILNLREIARALRINLADLL